MKLVLLTIILFYYSMFPRANFVSIMREADRIGFVFDVRANTFFPLPFHLATPDFARKEARGTRRELVNPLSVRGNPRRYRTRALTRKSNDCREGQAQADTTAETGRACGRPIRVQRPGAHAGDVQSAAGSAEEGEGPQAGSEEPQTHVAGTGSHGARNHPGHLHHD